ncbi:MAG TPA: methyltransferase [Myxococcota bacterium]|nr:methyltransferase [Myxococcota bacterium]
MDIRWGEAVPTLLGYPTFHMSDNEHTVDRLAGDWKIVQLQRGHRHTTDDLLTAWVGLKVAPGAKRLLDLGSGVGSIGLLGLFHRPEATLTSVELQEVSIECCRMTVAQNRVEDRVELRHEDLRDFDCDQRFDLITGNPPYVPVDRGARSPHPQRAAARLELNGDVYDWAATAARHLAPRGRFVLCHAAADPRPERAIAEVGLELLGRLEVTFREGNDAMIAIRVAGHGEHCELGALQIRSADGSWTEAWREVRRELAIDPG